MLLSISNYAAKTPAIVSHLWRLGAASFCLMTASPHSMIISIISITARLLNGCPAAFTAHGFRPLARPPRIASREDGTCCFKVSDKMTGLIDIYRHVRRRCQVLGCDIPRANDLMHECFMANLLFQACSTFIDFHLLRYWR